MVTGKGISYYCIIHIKSIKVFKIADLDYIYGHKKAEDYFYQILVCFFHNLTYIFHYLIS